MRNRSRSTGWVVALVLVIGGVFFADGHGSKASGGDDFAMYQLDVYCTNGQFPTAIFNTKGDGMMGTHWMCAGWCTGDDGLKHQVMIADVLAKIPEKISDALNEKIRTHERDAAIGIGNSIAGCGGYPKPKPRCEKYSGEIACDCNGDGKDETSKTFESCGEPSSFPRTFKSRCEDWATGSGFSYGTDLVIQREGRDYLKGLSCPALKCSQDYKACDNAAQGNYAKCIFGKKLVAVNRRCMRNLNNEINRCKQARTNCMNAARRSGSAPQP